MRYSEVEAMQDTCRNCLAQDVCDITGASCKKMDALFAVRKSVTNGRTTMTSSPKNVTPKTVAEAAEKNNEETTVPAQATAEKSTKTEKPKGDQVLDNKGKVLFSGTPDEVRAWLKDQPTMIYAVRQERDGDLIISTEYVEAGPLKLSLVQRAKAAAEKLKKNKKAMAILGGAAVVVGLTIRNVRKENREAVSAETLDEVEGPVIGIDDPEVPGDNTDSN